MNVGLLAVSFWRALASLVDEVRRTPAWVTATMLAIVIVGTLVALQIR